jgi:hypothetical protein
MELIREGQTKFEEGEYTAYIITENNCYRVEDEGRWYKDTAKYWAMGSGSEFALSAMLIGKSAKEAVKHACKLDVYSGGKIRVMQVRKVKNKTRKSILKESRKAAELQKKQKQHFNGWARDFIYDLKFLVDNKNNPEWNCVEIDAELNISYLAKLLTKAFELGKQENTERLSK